MNNYESPYIGVVISITIPRLSPTEQPFPYRVKTYVPCALPREEARAALIETVLNGAIAHLMETRALEEEAARALITPAMVKIEFLEVPPTL
jgi:hypothetical protein